MCAGNYHHSPPSPVHLLPRAECRHQCRNGGAECQEMCEFIPPQARMSEHIDASIRPCLLGRSATTAGPDAGVAALRASPGIRPLHYGSHHDPLSPPGGIRAPGCEHTPMGFADIVGHEKAIEALRRAAGSGRVAQAYLLVGPPNVGKTMVAKEFAKALN